MGSTADFKNGLTLEDENSVWKITSFLHVKPGKGPAFVRTTLKNLETGKTLDKTWRAGESFKEAQVEKLDCQYSYDDGDDMVFLDMESFEEERVARANVDKADYIAEEMAVTVLRWKGKTIDVQVPKTVVVKVAQTEPGVKGNSAGGRVEKPAKLETGAMINVPIFIEEGEEIKVDTDDGKYLGRTSGPGKSF
eukprot:CAMPEP_0119069160 /NCGR_PEP_ID=MMETSP1178-20130426/11667_1 /TAXON_ID=33656 /ORGANISM="unid sp, Strain CCMP2000" /LENGTH=192 /DNA_ID=CAMNT_0007050897 /DNA_START=140 /DNA_END=718 /DNA_ORIENTATION=+